MMESLQGGDVALAFVGAVFLGLQVWWISMTIRNGRVEKDLIRPHHTDEVKQKLEKIFSKSN